MNRRSCILLLAIAALMLGWVHDVRAQTKPSGELVWALHVSLSPSWFDPARHCRARRREQPGGRRRGPRAPDSHDRPAGLRRPRLAETNQARRSSRRDRVGRCPAI